MTTNTHSHFSHLSLSSHVFLSLLMSFSPSVLDDNDNDHPCTRLSLCPWCQSAWTLALLLFGEKLAPHMGLVFPVQTSCHLKYSGLELGLEMERRLVALKCVAGSQFAMLRRWRG